MRTVAAVLALVACVHAGLWALAADQRERLRISPDSWRAFPTLRSSTHRTPIPVSARPPKQIRADLKAIAPYTRAIRTYSSTGGAELIPPIAAEFGLKVTVGAWIDKNKERNEREIRSALDLARHNSNVNAIVVGNETMLRAETTVDELIKIIQRVKRQSPGPGDHRRNLDGLDRPSGTRLGGRFHRRAHPALLGGLRSPTRSTTPSSSTTSCGGCIPASGSSSPSSAGRAPATISTPPIPAASNRPRCCATSSHRAEAYGIDYNIVEAIDQPWKTIEGGVGPYWGLFDASREPKFSWTGPITDPDYLKRAGLAVLLGLLLSLPILAMSGVTLAQAVTLARAANVVGAWFAAIVAFWKGHYFVPGAAFALGLGVILLVPLVAIALARIEEIAAVAFGRAAAAARQRAAAGAR